MAALAREHGVEVEVARFEQWDDRGRLFDLITCGDAWHWNPVGGWRKIARVLAPGGTVARFWNHHEIEEPLKSAFEVIHRRIAPELNEAPPTRRGTSDDDPRVEHRSYPGSARTAPTSTSRCSPPSASTRRSSRSDWPRCSATCTGRSSPTAGPSTCTGRPTSAGRGARRAERAQHRRQPGDERRAEHDGEDQQRDARLDLRVSSPRPTTGTASPM